MTKTNISRGTNLTKYHFRLLGNRDGEFSFFSKTDDDIYAFIKIYNDKKINIKRGNKISSFKTKRSNCWCSVHGCKHPVFHFEEDGLYFEGFQGSNYIKE
jgi:hypothetical protein